MRSVKVFNTHRKHRVRRTDTIHLVHRVLKGERYKDAELNVVFVDDKQMIEMNRQYLQHNYNTDVLSFSFDGNNKSVEGEVYVNIDQARRQSKEYDVSVSQELQRLVAHGVLHLIGYDDSTKKLRAEMTEKENIYLL